MTWLIVIGIAVASVVIQAVGLVVLIMQDIDVTEAELQATIVETAELCGWLVFHDNDSRRNTVSPTSCSSNHPGSCCRAEITPNGRIRPEQRIWMDQLAECDTVASAIIRPEHLDQTIEYLTKGTNHEPV